MSSGNASPRAAPLSCREAARPTAEANTVPSLYPSGAWLVPHQRGRSRKGNRPKVGNGADLTCPALGSQPWPLAAPARSQSPRRRSGRTRRSADRIAHAGLLQQLLEAQCRLSPVVLVIEDLHWIDSVSEELLGKIIDSEAKTETSATHRAPLGIRAALAHRATVTKLPLEPLPTGDIRHLVRARLGVEALPDALARQVTEKAEGNPLFAEEIVAFSSSGACCAQQPAKWSSTQTR